MKSITITPQVRFSYDVCNGSAQERKDFATNVNEQIFDSVLPNIKNNKLAISDFEKSLHSSLPEDKRVDIEILVPEEDNVEGYSDFIDDYYGNFVGQTIEVPSKKGKVSGAGLVTLFHESRHVLDMLSNPKYVARIKSMYASDLYSSKYNKLSDEFYDDLANPTPENKAKQLNKLKKKLDKFLKGKPVENQIDCLQDLRYTMETERNAYADQYKFECRLRDKGIDTGDYVLEDETPYYFFDEKIDLLNKITAEIIAKERERHRLSLEG